MKRFLEIKVLRTRMSGDIVFVITNQSHRTYEFAGSQSRFVANNGFEISSSGHPEVSGDTLYVRGSDNSRDKDELIASPREFARIEEAIREYNVSFGSAKTNEQDEYLKRMGITP